MKVVFTKLFVQIDSVRESLRIELLAMSLGLNV